MAEPILYDFADIRLEVEWTPGSGTFARPCAIEGISVNRSKQIDESEVPADCDDESLPYVVRRNTRSRSTSVSGTGFMSVQNADLLLDWWRGVPAEKLKCRVFKANAPVGGNQYEEGTAIMSSFNIERTKGQQVTAAVEIVFDGDLEYVDRTA